MKREGRGVEDVRDREVEGVRGGGAMQTMHTISNSHRFTPENEPQARARIGGATSIRLRP
jgi:hypothetical protein